jgi:hypothetical protein
MTITPYLNHCVRPPAPVRLRMNRASPPVSVELRAAVVSRQPAREGPDDRLPRDRRRSLRRVIPPAAVRASGAGARSDGGLPAADCGFRGADGGEQPDDHVEGFPPGGPVGDAHARRAEGCCGRTSSGWTIWRPIPHLGDELRVVECGFIRGMIRGPIEASLRKTRRLSRSIVHPRRVPTRQRRPPANSAVAESSVRSTLMPR